MATPIYVIGHVNPDTDAIASAMGYAWLLRERDRIDVVAARAGPVNLQTSWVLKYLEMDPPFLLTDASSRFESVMRRFDTITPDKPLREGWAILSRTGGIAPVINEDGTPYGLLTGKSLFIFLSHLMGPRPRQQDMKISDILDVPCRQAVDVNVPRFHASHRIRDNINRVLREEGDEFWVVDDDNHYVGICRQRDLLNPPRIQVILVDHNEAHQALGSLEDADLMEILDHHRLGNPSTHIPIRFTVDVVGSTSTLVFERILEAGLSGPPSIAGMLLAGLLSDTLILTSPTTTDRDRAAAERLTQWAFSGGGALDGETIKSYGQKIISAGAGLGSKDPRDVVSSDMKIYRLDKFQFSIAQVEVSDLYELSEHVQELNKALQELKDSRGLDFAMLMVTDVVRGTSRLLVSEAPAQLEDLPYQPLNDGTREAEGIVSRKKQLLPVILSLLEN